MTLSRSDWKSGYVQVEGSHTAGGVPEGEISGRYLFNNKGYT